jgi:hypothetical protein
MARERLGICARRWGRGAAIAGAFAVLPTAACLVDVDESLLTRARAADASTADARVDGAGEAAAPYNGLACGTTRCQPPGEVCCATQFGDPDVANGICSTSDLCKTGDYFACTSPRDCQAAGLANAACCAVHDRGAFNLTKCAATCDATSSILCDPAGTACTSPRRCLPSPEFPKLYECLVPP